MSAPTDRAGLVRVMAESVGTPEFPADELDLVVARKHLAALEAAGLRVVPLKATRKMLNAGYNARAAAAPPSGEVWTAMVEDSPFAPPKQETPDGI